MEHWEIAETTWLLRSGFMDVRRDRCRTRDGRRSREYFALDLKDFCEVVAVTPARELLLAREYKHGARRIMKTLPAGFIESGESPEEAARRELLEETGYSAPAFQLLGSFQLVPDLTATRGHVVLALDATVTAAPHPDEDEEIEVEVVPLSRLLVPGRMPRRRLSRRCELHPCFEPGRSQPHAGALAGASGITVPPIRTGAARGS